MADTEKKVWERNSSSVHCYKTFCSCILHFWVISKRIYNKKPTFFSISDKYKSKDMRHASSHMFCSDSTLSLPIGTLKTKRNSFEYVASLLELKVQLVWPKSQMSDIWFWPHFVVLLYSLRCVANSHYGLYVEHTGQT